jgi:hypothetical protein
MQLLRSASFVVFKYLYPLLFILAVSIFLLHYIISGQAVYGDGIGYYAHVRSWVIDHNVDTTNEYKHLYNPENNNTNKPISVSEVQIVRTLPDGRAENFYSPGVGILLLPFFILADLLVYFGRFVGLDLHRTGYSNIYQILSGIGAISIVIFALVLLEKLLVFWTKNTKIAKLTIVSIFLGTQLLFYGSFDVLNSHFASFCVSVLFFFVLFLWEDSWKKDTVLGLVAGFAMSVRMQDGVLAIIWLLYIFTQIYPHISLKIILKYFRRLCQFTIGFFIGIVPSLLHWMYMFGSLSEHTYFKLLEKDLAQGRVIDGVGSLVHPVTGLFGRTPILLLAFWFFVYLVMQKKADRYWLLFIFFGIQYCIITLQGGWTAAAYGGRMYTSTLPFFALLLGEFFSVLQKRFSYGVVVILCIVVIGINFFRLGSFVLFEKEASGGKRGTEGYTKERIEQLIR